MQPADVFMYITSVLVTQLKCYGFILLPCPVKLSVHFQNYIGRKAKSSLTDVVCLYILTMQELLLHPQDFSRLAK